jgi:hypothetical protein
MPSEIKTMEANKVGCIFSGQRQNIAVIFFLLTFGCAFGQDTIRTTTKFNNKKFRQVAIASAAGYTLGMTGLYQLWYTGSARQSFRFFNDNTEWKQVDKIGHFGSAFYMSYGANRALRWSGVSQKRANLIASAAGFMIMLPIEVFDGFSKAYGASTGDLIANAGGATLFYTQQTLWNEIRIYPKFSFHTTRFAAIRPDLLGSNAPSQFFKDYNGQTYWFSFDMDKFIRFPRWLNIAAGYGAENMIYARDHQNIQHGFHPYRQYYLALDFDLTAIETNSKALKTLIFLVNIIHIPAPAFSFSKEGTRFHGFYF